MGAAHNADEGEEDHHSKREEGQESVGVDVGVTVLEDLHQQQSGDDEHEGRV